MIGKLHSRHRAIEFKKFLATIDQAVPEHLDVHLVLDNASTHKTPQIKRWLLAHPRFKLHFTPTSSSWINLVERWFAELTTKKLRRSAHRSVHQLNKDIRAWIETWNETPQPFVWTKTADQILESIARYCTRINETAPSNTVPSGVAPPSARNGSPPYAFFCATRALVKCRRTARHVRVDVPDFPAGVEVVRDLLVGK